MSFGQKIKRLRRDADMTQEQLAELLNISPQAVSRWETDTAMPDISMLPPLANMFHVTTDYLLDMEGYQKDAEKAEFDEAFHQYWNHDDKEKNYRIALRAVTKYPENMEYLEWLATAEYYVAVPIRNDEKRTQLLESSVKHYRLVLKNCSDQKLYSKALCGIVLSLHDLGKDGEAKDFAMKIKDEEKRDEMLLWCLRGDDRKKLSQQIAKTYLYQFLFYLTFPPTTFEARCAVEKILDLLFPDGNLQLFHNTMQYNCIAKAFHWCSEEKYDKAMCELIKARYHAEEMTKVNHTENIRYTAPLFHLVEETHMVSDSDVTDVDDFIRCLNNNQCFDPIREREDFKALLRP